MTAEQPLRRLSYGQAFFTVLSLGRQPKRLLMVGFLTFRKNGTAVGY